MELVLSNPELLPPEFRLKRLDRATFALQVPGARRPGRITVRPDVFEQHFESVQLLHAGGALFESIADVAGATVGDTESLHASVADFETLARTTNP